MSRMPFLADNSFVLIRIEEVLEEASTITDFNIVDIYDIAFQEVLPESYDAWASSIGELRWRFVKGNPKDEDACVECFKACFLKDDIDRAIKVRSRRPDHHTFPSSGWPYSLIDHSDYTIYQ
jgi:hypothetical protein